LNLKHYTPAFERFPNALLKSDFRFLPMPLYEYECQKCGHRFERIQKFSDAMVKKCPECGGKVEQMISAPAVQFKGSGWYVTDYAKRSGSSSSSESGGKSETNKESAESASSKEGKDGKDSKDSKDKKNKTETASKKADKK
jgi:putative FmdB family regulatory protein